LDSRTLEFKKLDTLSTLYIRLPSKATADSVSHWQALPCPFAVVSHGSAIERQGTASLSELSDTVAKSQHVVLLLAASDVTLLRVKVPPLSSSRLKAALPNLVEDQLITDPAGCVVVAGEISEGLRTVAVVQRAWLDNLAKTFIAFGAHHIAALPSQLCLPYQPSQAGQTAQVGSVTASIHEWSAGEQNGGIDIALRLSEQDGIGLAITHEKDESAASVALRTLCAVVSEAPVKLYVPQSSVGTYQDAVDNTIARNKVAQGKRINVSADNWPHWIAGAGVATFDLMAGLGLGTGPKLDWRAWRWPLALAAVVLIINIAALNIEWWRMKSEAKSLRDTMIQIYRSANPKESVIIDPLAQMQQKIAAAQRNSGLAAPDDYTAITAAFGEAWSNAAGKTASIASLEYREHSLNVRLKPGGEAPVQQIKAALAQRGLSLDLGTLDLAPGQSGAAVWKIRSAK
jgi:general secretion pathway protein L